jgi:hypothetical protein
MTPDIIEQVAMVTGRLIHQGTGKPVVGSVRFTAREGPVADKLFADGTFAVSGRPELLFPNLALQDHELHLNIRVDSAQFRAGFVEQTKVVPIPMGSTFASPISVDTIDLPADPVNIRGQVVEAANPERLIADATIEVLHSGPVIPPVTTDAEGRYRFDEITVTAPAQIRCAKPINFKTATRALLIDFGKLVNEEYFHLAPSP